MSVATENSAGATAIQPFTIPVTPGGGIETLRSRITATRWPGKKTDADQSHDVHLATKNELGFFRRRGRLPRALSGAAELGRAGPPNLIYFNEVDKGGHFAAWQEPDLVTTEVRPRSGHCAKGRSS